MIGGAIYGLSAAVMGEITFAGGAVEQGNFPDCDALRMHNTPAYEVKIPEAGPHLTGVGEPGPRCQSLLWSTHCSIWPDGVPQDCH